jgi:hypothetical protein
MQRAALREALLRRTGIVTNTGIRNGPGSAAHQAVKNGPLRCFWERAEGGKEFLPNAQI